MYKGKGATKKYIPDINTNDAHVICQFYMICVTVPTLGMGNQKLTKVTQEIKLHNW